MSLRMCPGGGLTARAPSRLSGRSGQHHMRALRAKGRGALRAKGCVDGRVTEVLGFTEVAEATSTLVGRFGFKCLYADFRFVFLTTTVY